VKKKDDKSSNVGTILGVLFACLFVCVVVGRLYFIYYLVRARRARQTSTSVRHVSLPTTDPSPAAARAELSTASTQLQTPLV